MEEYDTFVWKDGKTYHYWRYRAANGKILAKCYGYPTRKEAEADFSATRIATPKAVTARHNERTASDKPCFELHPYNGSSTEVGWTLYATGERKLKLAYSSEGYFDDSTARRAIEDFKSNIATFKP